MDRHDFDRSIDPHIQEFVRKKHRLLAGRPALRGIDAEDLFQHLRAHVLEKLSAYDPGRGPMSAFLHTLLEHAAANFFRDHFAGKRDPRGVISLNRQMAGRRRSAPELGDLVGQSAHARRTGRDPGEAADQVDLRLDLAEVLQTLPPQQRDLADRLMHKTVAQIARDLGVSRTTLREWVARLFGHLRERLQDYS